MDFRVQAGIVTGRHHLLDGRNCQDALSYLRFEIAGQPYITGALADGCGSGLHSEAGAHLAVQYATCALRDLVQQSPALDILSSHLFERLFHFLRYTVDSYCFADESERTRFVHDHLLFTLLGFLITPEETLIFVTGDGIVIINDDIPLEERHAAPPYIGYMLLQQHPEHPAIQHYQFATKELKRLAIGSDAWLEEKALLPEIWAGTTPSSLQRAMNKWSDARHFIDDASLIIVERIEEKQTVRGERDAG
jgi:hypothetical protein